MPENPPPVASPAPPLPDSGQKDRLLTWSVLAFLVLLYVPFAGNYGLWDPWETHYGEVARQMAARGDYISLWWPGSPQDPASGVFFSKPVLTFWLMAISLKLFGLGHGDAAHYSEMTIGWRGEWALRMPLIVVSLVGIWAVFELVRRLASRRAGLWTALVLATSAQWALITRQAMTDMPFVAPMTVAVCFAGLALIRPSQRRRSGPEALPDPQAILPRRSAKVLGLTLSFPDSPAFYGFLALYGLCVLPQLIVNLLQLQSFTVMLFNQTRRVPGALAALPFFVLFALSLYLSTGARTRRSLYLWTAYLMGGLATLAKGPAGIAMPILAVFVYLLVAGRIDELWGGPAAATRSEDGGLASTTRPDLLRQLLGGGDGLELMRGALVFFCVAAPWYVAMVARHGLPFWMELIGDNYVHRAQGRHGDRGTFEYYLRQLGAGFFPWSGVAVAAGVQIGRWLRADHEQDSARRQLILLCFVWFVVDFTIVTVVNTKFHHYILPALPALAALCGLFIDELCTVGERGAQASRLALWTLAGPVTLLSGRDLANFPARIGWLFNYDYVNVPGTGRPWPLPTIYGSRYEYGTPLFALSVVATIATIALALRRRRTEAPISTSAAKSQPYVLAGVALVIALVIGIAVGPSADRVVEFTSSKLPADTQFPASLRFGFLIPTLFAALWLLWLVVRWGGRAALPLGLLAVLSTTFFIDRYLVDISPHWSQKHIFTTYYRLRRGPEEPVVAWMMYWRGENLYTGNQIYDHRIEANEKTVFLGDKNMEKLQTYLNSHRGRTIYFLIERHRLEGLRSLLPQEAKTTLEVVDDTNNKVYLARARL